MKIFLRADRILEPVRRPTRTLVVLRGEPEPEVITRLVSDHAAPHSRGRGGRGRGKESHRACASGPGGRGHRDGLEDRVVEVCRDEDVEVVVVVPEYGEMEERRFGSFAERLGRDAAVPVLVVRTGGST